MMLALIIIAALALRLALTLSHPGYLGIDGGAYLLSVQQVLGQDPVGQDFTRPPLGPGWLLAPFTGLWGYDTGYKVWSAVFSLPPIPAVYLITRRFMSERVSLFAAALTAVNLSHAELLVTGALPLIGFGLIGLAMWGMWELTQPYDKRRTRPDISRIKPLAVTAAGVALIPYVNMTSAGLMALVLPLYALGLALFFPYTFGASLKERIGLAPVTLAWIIAAGIAGGLLALGALPWYTDVLPGSGNLVHPGPKLLLAPYPNWGWFVLFGAAPLGLWTLWKAEDYRLRAMGPVLVVLGLLAVVWSHDEAIINVTFRGRYLAIMLATPLLAYVGRRLWLWLTITKSPEDLQQTPLFSMNARLSKIIAYSCAFILLFIGTLGYVRAFQSQAHYSDQVTPTTAAVLKALKKHDPESPIIVNTFSMAWWVQALNGVSAPAVWNQEPPEKWQEEYEHVRCVLGWRPTFSDSHRCDTRMAMRAVAALGEPRWVLADTSFPERNNTRIEAAPESMWEVTASAPWLELAYDGGDTMLWRIRNVRTNTARATATGRSNASPDGPTSAE